MVKFNEGIYEYSNEKMRPSVMEIEGAYRDALHRKADKFVVHIDGRRFGYDAGRRTVYELKETPYQILRAAVQAEKTEVNNVENVIGTAEEPEIQAEADESNNGIELPETDDRVEVENEPSGEETDEIAHSEAATTAYEQNNAETTEEKTEEECDIAAEINNAADKSDEPAESNAVEDRDTFERLKSENAELLARIQILSSENVKYQRVIGIVLEMNSKIISALK